MRINNLNVRVTAPIFIINSGFTTCLFDFCSELYRAFEVDFSFSGYFVHIQKPGYITSKFSIQLYPRHILLGNVTIAKRNIWGPVPFLNTLVICFFDRSILNFIFICLHILKFGKHGKVRSCS